MWGTFFQPALWLTLGRYLIVTGAVLILAAIMQRFFRGWRYEARLFSRSIARLLLVCLLIFAGVQLARILGFFDAETLVASAFMCLSALLAVSSLVLSEMPDRMTRIVVPVGIMCVGGAAIIWARQWSGYITAGGFFLFVIAPGWLGRLARHLTEIGHVRAGSFFARIAWLLHPSTRTRFQSLHLSAGASRSIEQQVESPRPASRRTCRRMSQDTSVRPMPKIDEADAGSD